jgi:putative ABC transport system substrate-binding protein
MRRREFITLLGGAAACPMAARAQQPMPVIGYLNELSRDENEERLRAFHEGLGELGYVEGRNVSVEYHWTNGQYDRLPELAGDLVRRKVDVIVAGTGILAPTAAKAATKTIPIVFVMGSDPVQSGLVATLNRPEGNLTGISSLSQELGSKRLELLHELVPRASDLGALINPVSPTNAATLSRDLPKAAATLGVQLHLFNASTEAELDSAFAQAASMRVGGLVVGNDTFFTGQIGRLAALAGRQALPTIYAYRHFVAAGGLAGYGSSFTEPSRQAGVYAGRILKGEKPAELPVQLATKVELIINLKTAKTLGLTMPTALLVRADQVIE